MIIHWPGVTRQAETDEPVISTDFYPTILQMAGLPLMPGQHIDGISLLPILKANGKLKRENLFWHFPNYTGTGHPNPSAPLSVIRNKRYKLIEFLENGTLELYDLKQDIKEQKNLVKGSPKVAAKLQRQLGAWRKSAQVQMRPKAFPEKGSIFFKGNVYQMN
jgi:arylsulfatase A-like enzyme